MAITHKYIKERNFVLTLVGDGTSDDDLERHVHTITVETAGMSPFVELADASELHDLSGLTKFGVAMAGAGEIDRKPYKQDRLAILVNCDEAYNLAISYKATSLYFRTSTEIFTDFSSAVSWLGLADLESEIDELRKNGV